LPWNGTESLALMLVGARAEPSHARRQSRGVAAATSGVDARQGRSGNVWDNAAMESFFSSLKTERTARKTYRSRKEAKADVFDDDRISESGGVRNASRTSLGGCHSNRVQANVRSLTGKRITNIDLATSWEVQCAAIETMLKIATAYFSYSRADRERVLPFATMLASYDLAVWTDQDVAVGVLWQEQIESALRQAAHDGYLIAFLSQASLASKWARYEIETYAKLAKEHARLIPIELDPIDYGLLPPELRVFQPLQFHGHDVTTNGRMLLRAMGLDAI
jgi:hypothetical protein